MSDEALLRLEKVRDELIEISELEACGICAGLVTEEAEHIDLIGNAIVKSIVETSPEPELVANILAVQADRTELLKGVNEDADVALAEKGLPSVDFETYLAARLRAAGIPS